ncbi:MAG: DUF2442 domain-containing protein [Dehalococcoidia bacterium]|nr:DUF2442 domain-containing protein [Dehalococcoidia bacterium]
MQDTIIHGQPLGPRVISVTPTDDYKLEIEFDNGERRIFDATQLLSMKVFAPLRSKAFFKLVRVEYGSIAWPEDLDYCPDTLYMQSVPVSEAVLA